MFGRFRVRSTTRQGRLAQRVLTLIALACVLVGTWGHTASLKVMTRNMNEGTDYVEVSTASTPLAFLEAVTTTLRNVRATNPPARAAALADEIARTQPHLVGLQEATIWRTGSSPATLTIEFDLLQLLLDALARRGQHYAAVAIADEFGVLAPSSIGLFVRASNRDAILARTDLHPQEFQVSNPQQGHFAAVLTLSTAVGPVPIPRGWASVDVEHEGRRVRFVTTHLEDGGGTPALVPLQMAQATELLRGPANTTLPVVLAGDFNAIANAPLSPSFATYLTLVMNGRFVDAWSATHSGDLGFTCCQTPTLQDLVSNLSTRIDLVLARPELRARRTSLVGEVPVELPGGIFWVSDHARVVAHLQLCSSDDDCDRDE